VVEDTLASVEAVVRTQDKQGFRLLDKPKSFYFHDKSSGKNAVGHYTIATVEYGRRT
jgi:hypothetical protein